MALNNSWQSCGLGPLQDNARLTSAQPVCGTKEAARDVIMRECYAGEEYVLHLDPLFIRFLPHWDESLAAQSAGAGIITFVPQPQRPAVFDPTPDTIRTLGAEEGAGGAWARARWMSSFFMFAPATHLPRDLHDPYQPDDPRATSWFWTLKLCESPVVHAPTTQTIVQGSLFDTPCNKRRLRAMLGRLPCDICGQSQTIHTPEHALGHNYNYRCYRYFLRKFYSFF
jgi:hypothetical protein